MSQKSKKGTSVTPGSKGSGKKDKKTPLEKGPGGGIAIREAYVPRTGGGRGQSWEPLIDKRFGKKSKVQREEQLYRDLGTYSTPGETYDEAVERAKRERADYYGKKDPKAKKKRIERQQRKIDATMGPALEGLERLNKKFRKTEAGQRGATTKQRREKIKLLKKEEAVRIKGAEDKLDKLVKDRVIHRAQLDDIEDQLASVAAGDIAADEVLDDLVPKDLVDIAVTGGMTPAQLRAEEKGYKVDRAGRIITTREAYTLEEKKKENRVDNIIEGLAKDKKRKRTRTIINEQLAKEKVAREKADAETIKKIQREMHDRGRLLPKEVKSGGRAPLRETIKQRKLRKARDKRKAAIDKAEVAPLGPLFTGRRPAYKIDAKRDEAEIKRILGISRTLPTKTSKEKAARRYGINLPAEQLAIQQTRDVKTFAGVPKIGVMGHPHTRVRRGHVVGAPVGQMFTRVGAQQAAQQTRQQRADAMDARARARFAAAGGRYTLRTGTQATRHAASAGMVPHPVTGQMVVAPSASVVRAGRGGSVLRQTPGQIAARQRQVADNRLMRERLATRRADLYQDSLRGEKHLEAILKIRRKKKPKDGYTASDVERAINRRGMQRNDAGGIRFGRWKEVTDPMRPTVRVKDESKVKISIDKPRSYVDFQMIAPIARYPEGRLDIQREVFTLLRTMNIEPIGNALIEDLVPPRIKEGYMKYYVRIHAKKKKRRD